MKAFSCALVGATETVFNESHIREDLQIFDLSLSQDEGDFAALVIEVANPRVGLLAPGRPRYIWIGWNPNADNDDSGSSSFDDFVPLFFGRVNGPPEDLNGETVSISYTARPDDFEDQKAALAASLRVAPYFDPIWFSPETVNDADNVLESRAALWHIDRVSGAVTISDITTGEDGTIDVDEDTVFADSVRISFGSPPTRRIDVTATITWNQQASGAVQIVGGWPYVKAIETYTGQGLLDSWPKPGTSMGGGWSVSPASFAQRVDGKGNDTWVWDTNNILQYSFASGGKAVVVPSWATKQTVAFTDFPAHMLVLRKWIINAELSVQYEVSRGRTETMQFSLQSDTQSVLTDSTDGEPESMSFSTSEVSTPVDEGSSGDFTMPLGRPWARSYITTDRGAQSIEYLISVARAKLVASARCVDVSMDIPFAFAIAQGVSCRKSLVLTDDDMPGGIAGGKIKHYEFTANGDSGVLNCNVTIGCTIGRGGTIEAVEGDPVYVDDDYVDLDYQARTGEYVMPIAGEVGYSSINGAAFPDDGIDFDRMSPARVLLQPLTILNQADAQEPWIRTADQPDDVYKLLNDNAQTTISFELRPLNSGPFAASYYVDTTLLAIPKTIDLEFTPESSS